jgi:hypothetical protein
MERKGITEKGRYHRRWFSLTGAICFAHSGSDSATAGVIHVTIST